MQADVVLEGVTKKYGDMVAVDNISLSIKRGTYCCLLGPSGCGKTSTLRMIAGHEAVSGGKVLIRDVDVTNAPPAKRHTAMMFQDYALFPHMTLIDNVAFGLKMRGENKTTRRKKAEDMLVKVGLNDHLKKYPAQLSGGQRQRVALARALITEPAVVLLDEPLSALDRFVRIRMRGELRALQQQLGVTFIHVTHSQEEALALSDLVVVMDRGRIQQTGTPREVYDQAKTPFVATFMGDHNVLTGKVIQSASDEVMVQGNDGASFVLPGTATIGQPLSFTVRADHARLVNGKPTNGFNPINSLSGIASVVEYAGYQVRVKLEAPSGVEFNVYVPEQQFNAEPIALNQPIRVCWLPTDAMRLG